MSSSVEHSPTFVAVTLPDGALVPTVNQVADAFEEFDRAYRWFRDELDEINTSQAPLSQTSVDRLVALGGRMQPAAAASSLLAGVEPKLILAGVAVWVGRRTARGANYRPAAMRARWLWLAGGGQ